MNAKIEDLMYRAGLTASGCWDSMDEYDQMAIERLIDMVIRESASVVKHVSKQGGGNYGEAILEHFKMKTQ
jgi:hypothetical protein